MILYLYHITRISDKPSSLIHLRFLSKGIMIFNIIKKRMPMDHEKFDLGAKSMKSAHRMEGKGTWLDGKKLLDQTDGPIETLTCWVCVIIKVGYLQISRLAIQDSTCCLTNYSGHGLYYIEKSMSKFSGSPVTSMCSTFMYLHIF